MTTHQFVLSLACLIIVIAAFGLQWTDRSLPWWMLAIVALIPLGAMVIAEKLGG